MGVMVFKKWWWVAVGLTLAVVACEMRHSTTNLRESDILSQVSFRQQTIREDSVFHDIKYEVVIGRPQAPDTIVRVSRNEPSQKGEVYVVGEMDPTQLTLEDTTVKDGVSYVYRLEEFNQKGQLLARTEVPFQVRPDLRFDYSGVGVLKGSHRSQRVVIDNGKLVTYRKRVIFVTDHLSILNNDGFGEWEGTPVLSMFWKDYDHFAGWEDQGDFGPIYFYARRAEGNLSVSLTHPNWDDENPKTYMEGGEFRFDDTRDFKFTLAQFPKEFKSHRKEFLVIERSGKREFYRYNEPLIDASSVDKAYQYHLNGKLMPNSFCLISPIDGTIIAVGGYRKDRDYSFTEFESLMAANINSSRTEFSFAGGQIKCVEGKLPPSKNREFWLEALRLVGKFHSVMLPYGIAVTLDNSTYETEFTPGQLETIRTLIANPAALAHYLYRENLSYVEVSGGGADSPFVFHNQTLVISPNAEMPAAELLEKIRTSTLRVKQQTIFAR